MERLVIVPERWEHHIRQSSIDQMLEHLSGFELYEDAGGDFDGVPQGLFKGLGCVPNLRTAYDERAFRRELALMARLARESRTLLHFLSGESAVFLTPRHKGKNRIVATYHLPAGFMKEIIPDKSHFPLHDAVFVISPNQLDYFRELSGSTPVFHVPLGIETSYFPFGPAEERVKRVLFVGNWLRDFKALVSAVRHINQNAPEVEVVCVTPETNHGMFAGTGATLLTGIPTEHLLELYRTSSAFLFPVADCTGNTALLEAMCSGLPVVTNERTLTTGYVREEDVSVVADGNGEAMGEACLELIHDESLRRARSLAVRTWVDSNFTWPLAAKIQAEAYEQCGLSIPVLNAR